MKKFIKIMQTMYVCSIYALVFTAAILTCKAMQQINERNDKYKKELNERINSYSSSLITVQTADY